MNKIVIKVFAIVFISVALSSCSTLEIASETKYQQIMDSYVGKDISAVVKKLGYADEMIEAPNGNRVYVYISSSTSTSPVKCEKDASGNTKCTGGNTSTNWCKTYFEVAPNNTVKAHSYKGNNCRWCKSDAMLCI